MGTGARGGRRALLLTLLSLSIAVAGGNSGAATAETDVTVTDPAATIFRLSEEASFTEGCFEPCLCPLRWARFLLGTLVLEPPVRDGEIERRAVSEVNWTGAFGESTFSVIGSGMYLIQSVDADLVHSLELELSIDGEESQHFFSGFVPVSESDGTIDILISMNGMWCYDMVIEVKASQVPKSEKLPYQLVEPSSFQQGCFDPCDCPLEEPRPMSGGFTLVPLVDHGTFAEYAVSGVDFSVPATPDSKAINLVGFGSYTLIQDFAGPMHSLELMLSRNGGELELYDHAEKTEPTFPAAIDIAVDQNDRVCFDRVLSLHAVLGQDVIWHDGFESGDTSAWSDTVPPPGNPIAQFVYGLEPPLTVWFFNQSTGTPPLDYEWDFGDGSTPANRFDEDPIHTYATTGVYEVSLTATNSVGTDTVVKPVTVSH